MLRTSSHILKWNTANKDNNLLSLFEEYERSVNYFIGYLYQKPELIRGPFLALEHKKTLSSWLSARMVTNCSRRALQIMKSWKDKNSKINYKIYQRVFAKAKERGKNWDLVSQKFTDWVKGKALRTRHVKPVFDGNIIELDKQFLEVQEDKNSFDLWFKFSSLGQRLIFKCPSRKHKHFLALRERGFAWKNSGRLRKHNGNIYLDLYHEKEKPSLKEEGEVVGIDIGINKLLSSSAEQTDGHEVKPILQKIGRRVNGSKGHRRAIAEMKNKVGECLNRFISYQDLQVLVMEDIKKINHKSKNRTNKTTRKLLSNWNYRLLLERVSHKCEENGVLFTQVNPAYTSQQCSSCGVIRKESRKGERYDCPSCGMSADADINGAKNILNRFLNKKSTVSCELEINNENKKNESS